SRVAAIHKVRTIVLLVGVASVALGWWLEQRVAKLTKERDEASDQVLLSSQPTPEEIQNADSVRAEFRQMHGWSMALNLVTVLCVTAGMALAAHLPGVPAPGGGPPATR